MGRGRCGMSCAKAIWRSSGGGTSARTRIRTKIWRRRVTITARSPSTSSSFRGVIIVTATMILLLRRHRQRAPFLPRTKHSALPSPISRYASSSFQSWIWSWLLPARRDLRGCSTSRISYQSLYHYNNDQISFRPHRTGTTNAADHPLTLHLFQLSRPPSPNDGLHNIHSNNANTYHPLAPFPLPLPLPFPRDQNSLHGALNAITIEVLGSRYILVLVDWTHGHTFDVLEWRTGGWAKVRYRVLSLFLSFCYSLFHFFDIRYFIIPLSLLYSFFPYPSVILSVHPPPPTYSFAVLLHPASFTLLLPFPISYLFSPTSSTC